MYFRGELEPTGDCLNNELTLIQVGQFGPELKPKPRGISLTQCVELWEKKANMKVSSLKMASAESRHIKPERKVPAPLHTNTLISVELISEYDQDQLETQLTGKQSYILSRHGKEEKKKTHSDFTEK